MDNADGRTNDRSTTENGTISESDISERKMGRGALYGLMWRKNTWCALPRLHFSPPNLERGSVIIHTQRITGKLREMVVMMQGKIMYPPLLTSASFVDSVSHLSFPPVLSLECFHIVPFSQKPWSGAQRDLFRPYQLRSR